MTATTPQAQPGADFTLDPSLFPDALNGPQERRLRALREAHALLGVVGPYNDLEVDRLLRLARYVLTGNTSTVDR